MNCKKILIIFIITIILIGFILPTILPINDIRGCTEMGCICSVDKLETPCNSCSRTKFHFLSFIVNYYETCSEKEVLICENGKNIDTRYDIKECKKKVSLFFWNIL